MTRFWNIYPVSGKYFHYKEDNIVDTEGFSIAVQKVKDGVKVVLQVRCGFSIAEKKVKDGKKKKVGAVSCRSGAVLA